MGVKTVITYTCDNCGKTEKENSDNDYCLLWWHLNGERAETGPYHPYYYALCSEQCVNQFSIPQ